MILEYFYPHIYVESIYDLPLEKLKERGIKGLIFDIDNTIAPHDVAEPDEKFIEFSKTLKEMDFSLAILSNNNQNRVNLFNQQLQFHAVYKGGKPNTKKIKSIMEALNLSPSNTAMIGDQVFTDMFCGRLAKTLCIYTKPVCNRDQFVTKVKRGAEKQVLKQYFKMLENKKNNINTD